MVKVCVEQGPGLKTLKSLRGTKESTKNAKTKNAPKKNHKKDQNLTAKLSPLPLEQPPPFD